MVGESLSCYECEEMASLSPQALTPRKRQIERALDKADAIIRSGNLSIGKNFYGSCKRTRPRYSQDLLDQADLKKTDVYEFDENGETPHESAFTRVIKPHEIGFPNPLGANICWMNSTLQIMFGMKSLIDDLEAPRCGASVSRNHYSSILQSFLDLVRHHKRGRLLPVHKDISTLREALAALDSGFACEYMQDAPEFLIRLLDNFRENFYEIGNSEQNNNGDITPLKELKLTNCMNQTSMSPFKKQKINPICDNLQFSMKETYCCTSCGHKTEKTQEHLVLYVDIPMEKESSASVTSALEQYMEVHTRDLLCEKCHGEQCRVNTVFNQLSRFLLIQVKRYTYLEHLTQKITNSIEIPLDLDVSSVVDNNAVFPKSLTTVYEKKKENIENERLQESPNFKSKNEYEEETDDDREESNPKYTYRLTGILSHYGDSPNAGHYVADVYHHVPRQWFHYDDENVETVREEEILNESRERSGYLFVYTYRPLYDELSSKPRSGG